MQNLTDRERMILRELIQLEARRLHSEIERACKYPLTHGGNGMAEHMSEKVMELSRLSGKLGD